MFEMAKIAEMTEITEMFEMVEMVGSFELEVEGVLVKLVEVGWVVLRWGLGGG